ncbi:MAG TPA: sugar-binding transcriptional regulator [Gemmatimonadaceae bacterium]|jgi:DNA-binding transcriptional regulator LsrR (DeoR family)|nr:sugar-binding transcriptional regulator [Gemmatimonadaceae bacterium]
MPRPRSAPDLYLLSKVSTLYYLRDQTQQEIAERIGLSRPAVSRLLRDAQAHGIVQITISPPEGLHLELETRLEERFGLGVARVVPVETGTSAELLRRQIGATAAGFLARSVQPGETIGLAWGTTLSAMVQAMAPLATENVHVVQTLGGIGPPAAEAYAAELVRKLAQLLGAAPILFPTPGVVATAEVRDVLRNDPHVQAALKHFDTLDTVYVGIGAIGTNPVLNDGRSLPADTHASLVEAGAVGDIALRFFDADGAPVHTSLDDRILGITAEQLHKVPRVVAVAGGADKVDAILAALKSKMVDVLITDHDTAEELVRRAS